MNKYCPSCKMNVSESFEQCPCCDGELITQELSASETIELDILKMTDDELLLKYNGYLESIREQGFEITDKEFTDGLREGKKGIYKNTNETIFEKQQPTSSITCPYCKSTNCTRITATAKAINTALFGIFGNKRRYQWHCNNCKSDF